MQSTALRALTAAALALPLAAQQPPRPGEELFDTLHYRCIGPFRGGRSAACAGHPDQPATYWFGACGGGVWKTTDSGATWDNVSDGTFGGSIGAVAVAPSDPNVVYVGGGEVTVRGNVSHGDGVWKTVDGGRTWTFAGLPDSHHVPRIRIHPRDPDLVYATALGHLFGPNPERGVYRSRDGGTTWERVLFVDEHTGGCDLVMDPADPRTLYASTWRVRRTPYSLDSGGEGSALWKTTDGGDTWTELSTNKGMPEGTLGIIGVAIAPSRPDRVYAIVEHEKGGVFRSEDGGDTWKKVNSDRELRQRAWYYSRIYCDPLDANTVYVLNVRMWRSRDGGKTFEKIATPHVDNHDLWIDPHDPARMIEANDGGANVSTDGGASWSTQSNQPTAQFYRVTTDTHQPYRVYGAQQDNSTVRILSQAPGGIGDDDWEPTAGGESGHLAPDPDDPEVVYGGSYSGYLLRYDHRRGERRRVDVWPDNPIGHGAANQRFRFQWNFPIFFSPHDSSKLYTAAQMLFESTDEGQSWRRISPDLTRDDESKQQPSGGPITKDNTGVEVYCTIFAALESPHEPGVLWCGSDDGLLHLSRDGGATWSNVTPPDLPEWTQINSLEAHPTEPGGLYVAGTRYKLDDFRPYLWKTIDYGATWTAIADGIDPAHFTRVVRADPVQPGLLYCGTERGVYVSFDDGASWCTMQLDLPVVPVTDLAIPACGSDLVVATQGRAFWILDDLHHLRQLARGAHDLALYEPEPVRRFAAKPSSKGPGENPRGGVVVRFRVPEAREGEVVLEFRDRDGTVLHRLATDGEKREKLEVEPGLQVATWDLRLEDAAKFEGMRLWSGHLRGPRIVPGPYEVALRIGADEHVQPFEVLRDPGSTATDDDLRAQFDLLLRMRDQLTRAHRGITRLRALRAQIEALVERAGDAADLADRGAVIVERLTAVEEALYQTELESEQDMLNFPVRLTNKLATLAGVVATGDWRPTARAVELEAALSAEIASQLDELRAIEAGALAEFNALARELEVPHIGVAGEPSDDGDK